MDSPRPRDVIKTRLAELQTARAKAQNDVLHQLRVIDALSRRIATGIDELAATVTAPRDRV